MDSIKCEAYLLAAEHGSLTSAADCLGYTQPGITRMIHSLEEELGFPLLVRSSKGVVPTENGKLVIPLFREIVHASKNLEEISSDIKGLLTGTLIIGSYFSISSMVLPSIIKEFSDEYPNIKISVIEGGNQEFDQWLSEKKVDFCFGAKPECCTEWEWVPIFKDEQKVWLYEQHPKYHDPYYPITQLNKEELIVTLPDGDNDMDRMIEKYDLKSGIRFTTSNAYTTYRMVEAGLGISVDQNLLFKGFHGSVKGISFHPSQYIEMGIIMPSLADASPASRKMIERIKNKYL